MVAHQSSLADTVELNRRTLMCGTAAAVGSALLLRTSGAESAPRGLGAQMIGAVEAWLASLEPAQRNKASLSFDGRTWRRWSYMYGSLVAPGLPLEQMRPPQRDAALAVLALGLSGYGMETASNIMLQQDVLRDEWGKGSPDRNAERFSLMVFGKPSSNVPWAWRWEGHHLTITFTLVGDRIVAHTPKAFSSEPNTVPSGPYAGLVVLPENESLGRTLFADLAANQQRQARLQDRSFGNVLTFAGQENAVGSLQGVALGDLTTSQSDIARRLIDLYTFEHLAKPLADQQRQRIEGQDLAACRFGWAGDPDRGSIYYRLHGETFLIEFATLPDQPLHHHTIVHDLQRNLGDYAI